MEHEKMRNRFIGIIACGILVTTLFPLGSLAEFSDGPEVEDRIRDVRLFGLFRVIPQNLFRHIDVVSAWFSEQSDKPDYLYVSLRLRDIEETTDILEAIYVISWLHNNNYFLACVHVFPSGVKDYCIGLSMDGNSVIDKYIKCSGSYDLENDIITWMFPKDAVGTPQSGEVLYDIRPRAHLRFPYESGFPMIDLFKDLSHNAKSSNRYFIQY
jgi:hypothetical protein